MQRVLSLAAALLLITAPCLHANVATGNLGRLLEEDGLPMPHDWARQLQGNIIPGVGSFSFDFTPPPTPAPSAAPTAAPSPAPTAKPTSMPSPAPTQKPTKSPPPNKPPTAQTTGPDSAQGPAPAPTAVTAPVPVVSVGLELAGTKVQNENALAAIVEQLAKVTGKKGTIKPGPPQSNRPGRALPEAEPEASPLPSLQEIVGALCAMNTERDAETIELEDYSDQAAVEKALTDIVDGTVSLTLDDGTAVRSTVCKVETTLRSSAPDVTPLDNNSKTGDKAPGLAKSYVILIAVLGVAVALVVGFVVFRRARGARVTQI